MSRFAIKEFAYSTNVDPLAVVDADSPTDALAEFAISEGFADPRETIGSPRGEDFFYVMDDGTVGMVFTNTEVYAEKVS